LESQRSHSHPGRPARVRRVSDGGYLVKTEES